MSYANALNNLGKQDPLKLAGAAVLIIAALYYLTRKTVTDVAEGVGGVISGNNAVTQNQTNLSGQSTDAYEGKGVAGTLGAVVNSATGGIAASAGESIGGWIYDLTHLDW